MNYDELSKKMQDIFEAPFMEAMQPGKSRAEIIKLEAKTYLRTYVEVHGMTPEAAKERLIKDSGYSAEDFD